MHIKLIKNTFFDEKNTKEKLVEFIKKAKILSMSKECQKAEKKFAKHVKRKYCALFNSGSSANLALVQSYLNLGKIKKGDKIGVSALTWSTTIMPIIQLGLVPVPIDVNLETLNVDSDHLSAEYKKNKFKAFFSTNVLGFSGDVKEIKNFCDKNEILFFEDNCESFGSKHKGTLLGGYGNSATYSFYVGHHLSAIEGGAVCTDDLELFKMLVIVRAHGWDRNLPPVHQNDLRKKYNTLDSFYDKYTFYDLGFNLRPTEITGFLLNETLKHADEIVKSRENNFTEIYNHALKILGDDIYPLKFDHLDIVSNFAIPIIAKDEKIFNKLVEIFMKNGIEIRPIIAGNLVLQPFFKKYVRTNYKKSDLPNVNIIHDQGFYFGNNPDLTRREINHIKSIFTKFRA